MWRESVSGVITGTLAYIIYQCFWLGNCGPGWGGKNGPAVGPGKDRIRTKADLPSDAPLEKQLRATQQLVEELEKDRDLTRHIEVAKALEEARQHARLLQQALQSQETQLPVPQSHATPSPPEPATIDEPSLQLRARRHVPRVAGVELNPKWIFKLDAATEQQLRQVKDGDIPLMGKLLDPFGNVHELPFALPEPGTPGYADIVGVSPEDMRVLILKRFHGADRSYFAMLNLLVANVLDGIDRIRKEAGDDTAINPKLFIVLPDKVPFNYAFRKTLDRTVWDGGSARNDKRFVELDLSGAHVPERARNLGLFDFSNSEVVSTLGPAWEGWMKRNAVEALKNSNVYYLACTKKTHPRFCDEYEKAIQSGSDYRRHHGTPLWMEDLKRLPQAVWEVALRWRIAEKFPFVSQEELSPKVQEAMQKYRQRGNAAPLQRLGVDIKDIDELFYHGIRYVVASKAIPTFRRLYANGGILPRLSRIIEFLRTN